MLSHPPSSQQKQVTEQECPVDTLPEEEAQGHTDATPEPDTKDDASVVLAQAEKFLQAHPFAVDMRPLGTGSGVRSCVKSGGGQWLKSRVTGSKGQGRDRG